MAFDAASIERQIRRRSANETLWGCVGNFVARAQITPGWDTSRVRNGHLPRDIQWMVFRGGNLWLFLGQKNGSTARCKAGPGSPPIRIGLEVRNTVWEDGKSATYMATAW